MIHRVRSGASILGDGTLALILDINRITEEAYEQERRYSGEVGIGERQG
jgi:chemotaxis protein histidine kinase CheA